MLFEFDEFSTQKARIKVLGVGGAGGNAINRMITSGMEGVEFIAINTDAQDLDSNPAETKIQIGKDLTKGLGAGAKPEIGRKAIMHDKEAVSSIVAGSDLVFVTAGMGGGTGTGAAPIIAQAARELGVLTVGVVTKPFQFEGVKRMRQAEEGVEALQKMVDTLIIIPNQNLFRIANEKTTFTEAFSMADDVLYQGVKGVTDLMVRPGLINLDFADVRAIMDEMGKAMMGTGEAEGEDRAIQASEKAIANPLLDEISLRGAKGVLINITGGYDLTLFELDEAANRIREEVDPDANIIVGSTLDTELEGKMRVSVVATGIDAGEISQSFNESQMQETELVSDQIVEQADQNLSLEEPLVAKTQEIFDQIDNEISSDISTDQPLATDDEYKEENGLQAASVASSFQEPSGIPTAETLERLRAAVSKENSESPMPQNNEQPSEIERPKFGISSLISRMSRSEGSDISSEPRKEPNFNSTDDDNSEQDKIEVPAFLRRQAN